MILSRNAQRFKKKKMVVKLKNANLSLTVVYFSKFVISVNRRAKENLSCRQIWISSLILRFN